MDGRTAEFSVFGLSLSAAAWCVPSLVAPEKDRVGAVQPAAGRQVLIIALLAVFDIPLENYNIGGRLHQADAGPGDGGAGFEYLPAAEDPAGALPAGPGGLPGGERGPVCSVFWPCARCSRWRTC